MNNFRNFFMKMFNRFIYLRFLLVGVSNTVFSTIIFMILLWFGFSLALGNGLALACGILLSYYTQGTFVFRHKSAGAFIKYLFVWALLYFANLYEVKSMIALGANRYLAVAGAVVPTTIFSFIIQKLFVFKSSGSPLSDLE